MVRIKVDSPSGSFAQPVSSNGVVAPLARQAAPGRGSVPVNGLDRCFSTYVREMLETLSGHFPEVGTVVGPGALVPGAGGESWRGARSARSDPALPRIRSTRVRRAPRALRRDSIARPDAGPH